MTIIIDYGAGNLGSVDKAFNFIGVNARVSSDPEEITKADSLVLPGVGAFGDVMNKLKQGGFDQAIIKHIKSGKPFLGICLGLQLLFEHSEESEGVRGLGIFKGSIRQFPKNMGLKIPQIGWNDINIKEGSRLFAGMKNGSHFYFVHSYYLTSEDRSVSCATCDYGITFDAAIEKDNIFAAQFHPEKSGEAGLQVLRNFSRIK